MGIQRVRHGQLLSIFVAQAGDVAFQSIVVVPASMIKSKIVGMG
jgi:hypothetical protein